MIIRAYQLKKGCHFRKNNVEYVVTKREEGRIYYRHDSAMSARLVDYIGWKSRERVELLGGEPLPEMIIDLLDIQFHLCEPFKYRFQKTKPIKEVYESSVH